MASGILILFRIGYCAVMRRTGRRKPPQPALPWPGTDETCPRCHGTTQVYYRAAPDGVEIVGGKRMPCPVCQGVGTVRTPLTPQPPALPEQALAASRTKQPFR